MRLSPVPRLLRVASFRLAAIYVALFAGSALVLGVAVFLEARSALQRQIQARIETETVFLREEFAAGGLQHLITLVQTRVLGVGALDYVLSGPKGEHLAGDIPALNRRIAGWTTIMIPESQEYGGQAERVRALVSDLGNGIWVAVADDLRQVDDLEKSIARAFLWTVGLAGVLGVVGGALLSRGFLKRVESITSTAEAIIGGDLTHRVPVHGTGDDLDDLAETLNRMLDRIADLMESLRQVSTDVAHDLRTPLSRLYHKLEGARGQARSMAEYDIAIDAALVESQALLETFSALLRIAQVEGASPRAEFREVDLTAIAETVADAYRPEAEDTGHQLTTDIAPGILVSGDQELLTQAVANLVENALRHTLPGSRINLRIEGDRWIGARLVVQDNGTGVSEADLPRLTDRFYRAERSRTTPGNGLGLSLVAAVAELHGARLNLQDNHPGLCAIISFPTTSGLSSPAESRSKATAAQQRTAWHHDVIRTA